MAVTQTARLPLAPDEAHVWYLLTERLGDLRCLDGWHALMSAEERARHARFVFQKDRDLFLVSRALIRTLLSQYLGGDPAAWTFSRSRYGRPSLQNPPADAQLDFNLSHATGVVTCAVTLRREVGVDVEDTRRVPIEYGLFRHYFSASEVADLEALPLNQRSRRFFEYWTLKEAYLKATGLGLSLPLDAFSICLQPGRRARICFAPAIADDAASWQLEQFVVEGHVLIALAVRRRGPDVAVRVREFESLLV